MLKQLNEIYTDKWFNIDMRAFDIEHESLLRKAPCCLIEVDWRFSGAFCLAVKKVRDPFEAYILLVEFYLR